MRVTPFICQGSPSQRSGRHSVRLHAEVRLQHTANEAAAGCLATGLIHGVELATCGRLLVRDKALIKSRLVSGIKLLVRQRLFLRGKSRRPRDRASRWDPDRRQE